MTGPKNESRNPKQTISKKFKINQTLLGYRLKITYFVSGF